MIPNNGTCLLVAGSWIGDVILVVNLSKRMKFIPTLLVVILFVIIPSSVDAANFVTCSGTDCSACNLAEMGNEIMKWLIGVLFVVFGVVAAVGGFGLVTSGGNPGALDDAKKKLTSAVVGLLIVLAAWLLVDTIIRGLVSGGTGQIKGKFWYEVECQTQEKSVMLHSDYIESDPTIAAANNNCGASEADLVTIPGTSVKALQSTADNFVAMRTAAAKDGINLVVNSGWRSDATQVELWNKYCPGGTCGAAKVAKPCSLGGNGSNHNSGAALDIAVGCSNGTSGCNTPTYQWLKNNGSKYGFINALPTDPLHWSPSGK